MRSIDISRSDGSEFQVLASRQLGIAEAGLSAWKPEGSVQMPIASLVYQTLKGVGGWGKFKSEEFERESAPIARPRK